jgi:acyl carrier protein
MIKAEVIETINNFLVDEFEVEPDLIVPSSNLRETLELDSLDYVDLVVVIESNFGFKPTAEDFKTIGTFQDLYDYIFTKVAEV